MSTGPTVVVVEVEKPEAAATTAPESESVVEEIIDAILDPFGEDDATIAVPVAVAGEIPVVEPVEFDMGMESAMPLTAEGVSAPFSDETPVDAVAEEPAATADGTATEEVSSETLSSETQGHIAAATESQAKADEAVAAGDYEAASHLRDTAEDEAWAASDSSMLHGSDSAHLETAASQQETAEYYEKEEAHHAEAGEYEAARDDAAEAASATSFVDFNAGGADHTAQADDEYHHMDSAASEQQWATEDAHTAEGYAEEGDWEHADQYAESAADHQDAADYQGELGEHGGELADHDASSDVGPVDSGDTYDSSSSTDTSSSYESSSSMVDDSSTDSSA